MINQDITNRIKWFKELWEKILEEISKLWKKYPDLRFGQLLENIFGCEKNDNRCIFNIDDDKQDLLKTKNNSKGE